MLKDVKNDNNFVNCGILFNHILFTQIYKIA